MSFTDVEPGAVIHDPASSDQLPAPKEGVSAAERFRTPQGAHVLFHKRVRFLLVGWSILFLVALLFPAITTDAQGNYQVSWFWAPGANSGSGDLVLFFHLYWFVAAVTSLVIALVLRGIARGLVILSLLFAMVLLNPVAQAGHSGFFPLQGTGQLLAGAPLVLLFLWASLVGTLAGSSLRRRWPERLLARLLGGISGSVLLAVLLLPLVGKSHPLLELLFRLGERTWTIPLFGLGLVAMGVLATINLGHYPPPSNDRPPASRRLGQVVVLTGVILSIALFVLVSLYALIRGNNALFLFSVIVFKLFGLFYSILYLSSLALTDLFASLFALGTSALPAPHRLEEKLHTLDRLFNKGLITPDEYREKRSACLRKI